MSNINNTNLNTAADTSVSKPKRKRRTKYAFDPLPFNPEAYAKAEKMFNSPEFEPDYFQTVDELYAYLSVFWAGDKNK